MEKCKRELFIFSVDGDRLIGRFGNLYFYVDHILRMVDLCVNGSFRAGIYCNTVLHGVRFSFVDSHQCSLEKDLHSAPRFR